MKCKFEESLIDYQEDLKRILGKHLNSNSGLSIDEVVSTINLQLIKTKDKFFDKFGYNFKVSDFKKWAYAFARNNSRWSEIKKFHDEKHLQDGTYQTEDGLKTLFEIACETEGEEDSSLEKFDENGKVLLIEKIIDKYSNILTENEKSVFKSLLNSETELEISQRLDVTRQAVNVCKKRIYEKIQSNYKISVEDAPRVSPTEMRGHIDSVLDIFGKIEKRRLRVHCFTKFRNEHPYYCDFYE